MDSTFYRFRQLVSAALADENIELLPEDDPSSFHAECCSLMFERCINGDVDFYICFEDGVPESLNVQSSEQRVFSDDAPIDSDSSKMLAASIMSEDMLKYDGMAFSFLQEEGNRLTESPDAQNKIGYRPYFIEFLF